MVQVLSLWLWLSYRFSPDVFIGREVAQAQAENLISIMEQGLQVSHKQYILVLFKKPTNPCLHPQYLLAGCWCPLQALDPLLAGSVISSLICLYSASACVEVVLHAFLCLRNLHDDTPNLETEIMI